MKEVRLQADIARRFSELYPHKKGQLFHVSNERNNKIQAFQARAIGIVPGVADFVYFSKSFNVAIELKVPGSRHDVNKIRKQYEWGRTWQKQGNVWRLCMSVEEAIACTEGDFQGMTLAKLKSKLKSCKTKTMKF